jgi:CheY-like chemotaxis protein
MHGGTVRADSSGEGEGATFTVQLPLMIVNTGALRLERIHPVAVGGSLPSEKPLTLEGLRVLIVDDEPDTLAMLRVMVGNFQADVKCCSSAAEALAVLNDWKPNVLISDIEMPDEDGYQLIRKIRDRDPQRGGNVPAVALTAYARSEDRMRALSAGYQMHLAKPFEPAELSVVIASLAGRHVKGSVV